MNSLNDEINNEVGVLNIDKIASLMKNIIDSVEVNKEEKKVS